MKYRFIQTDQVQEVSDQLRDLVPLHEDHDPEEHTCAGCTSPESDECWAERHGTEVVHHEGPRRVGRPGDDQCHCLCHQLVAQCRHVQNAARAEGLPIYRLFDEETAFSMEMPQSVYEDLMDLPEEVRDEAVGNVLAHAKAMREAKEGGSPTEE
jgi:hypothetical protein